MMMNLMSALAESGEVVAATGEGAVATSSGIVEMIVMMVVMVAVFYFFLIRPQKKKEKADRQLRASLQAGDKIVTIGGFTGRILSVKDDEVTFETGAAKTRLTVKKWAIQTREGPEAEVVEEETSSETEESK